MGNLLHSSDIYGPGRFCQAQKAHRKQDPQSTTSSSTGLHDEAVRQHDCISGSIAHNGKARHRRDIKPQTEFAPHVAGPRSNRPRQSNRSHEAPMTENAGEELSPIWPTPSDDLLAAMGPLREIYAKPEAEAQKPDLSYISPISLAMDKSRGSMGRREIWKKRQKVAAAMVERNTTTRRIFKRSLPSFLAKYMELVDTVVSLDPSKCISSKTSGMKENGKRRALPKADTTTPFFRIFNEKNLAWLSGKGYDISDLTTWEWILTAKSAEQAALRLTVLAKQQHSNLTTGKSIPTFVLLFLLRRQDTNSRCLLLLLEHAWDRLLHQGSFCGDAEVHPPLFQERKKGVAKQFFYSEMSEPTIFLMVVRFLRQARKVWPAAIVSIAAMMTKYIGGTSVRSDSTPGAPIPEQTSARLTFLYNKMLSLLGLPSNMHPFKSLVYHQQAQFIVLKRMSEFQPTLIVTREGYRGIITVQLAHKKTSREREWAAMKALSWPPWKEEKLGIDKDIGVEHGISRASEALLRARESGHPLRAWEDVAGVLAGWDTDRSPTIQTRAIVKRNNFLPDVYRADAAPSAPVQHDKELWAARIRATRTVDEAWACFLAFKSLKDSQPSEVVYYAMFEKVISEAKRVKRGLLNGSAKPADDSRGTSKPLPGDGKETFPVPGPREAIYVRTPTPDVKEYFNMMTDDKIKLSGRFLAFSWHHADTFEVGIKYLRESSLDFSTIQALLGQNVTREVKQTKLMLMGDHLFASFIAFLSRFAPSIRRHNLGSDYNVGKLPLHTVFSHSTMIKLGSTHINPLLQASQLMEIRKPYYQPPWTALLSALARPGRIVNNFQMHDLNTQDAMTWKAMCSVLSQMREIGLDVDFSGFQILCVGLEKAIIASQRLIHAYNLPVSLAHGRDQEIGLHAESEKRHSAILDAEQVLSTGVLLVKSIFKRLVETGFGWDNLTPHVSEPLKGPDSIRKITRLPKLQEMPRPAHLHAFIRVLGLREDYIGILSLVQWMGCHTPELMAVASEPMKGMHLARRCVIAIRVFLERSWLMVDHEDYEGDQRADDQVVDDGAPREIVQKVFAVIDENEDWGGWPTDVEVTAYCRKGRFS